MKTTLTLALTALALAACGATEPSTQAVEETVSLRPIDVHELPCEGGCLPLPEARAESNAIGGCDTGLIRCGTTEEPPAWTTAVDPKPLSASARRGLAWLVATQHADGGWGQGEESAQMRGGRDELVLGRAQAQGEPSNVADTCIALLALLRADADPAAGPYAEPIRRGLAFVCGSVEASDEESIYVTELRNTRVQMKIGHTVDTFLASLALTELKGKTGREELDQRVARALDKVLGKIETNQQADGAFEGQGWAPVLSQGIAGKALARAGQLGAPVAAETLTRNQAWFADQASGPATPAGSAGVALYATSAGLAGLQEHANTDALNEPELQRIVAESKDEDEVRDARKELARIAGGRRAQEQARQEVVGRLDDEGFVNGFGSNGGEEFLSYMNISESLVVQGGEAWSKWDAAMTGNLARIQNQDGSWSGHHCITGRNFCTATALLVLLADRTPVPSQLVASR